MNDKAAVTICSISYLPRALVLFESYRSYHPSHSFFIVLIGKKTASLAIERVGLTLLWLEDLPVPNLLQHAFAFDVVELSTNVKPIALLTLLREFQTVVYLDPDIQVFASLTPVFEALNTSPIVVTPHSNTPVLDGAKPDDLDLLKFGPFNLGFIGVARGAASEAFLNWWSDRCLEYGYYEPQLGLAVDQKWVSLGPCFFPMMRVLTDVGLNVAFWNLHERRLSRPSNAWMVNDTVPLRFVHFSSLNPRTPAIIAEKQTRFQPGDRPDFQPLVEQYSAKVLTEDVGGLSNHPYSFDYFEDGARITATLRRFYAGLRSSRFAAISDPFATGGEVRRFAQKNGLLGSRNRPQKRETFRDVTAHRGQIMLIHRFLRLLLRVFGPDRYFSLMRYLAHISSIRNQAEMFRSSH